MLVQQRLSEQIDAQAEDRLKVLVVGAGVGGLTLAQLLRRHGLHPVLVERAAAGDDAGYMLGLMPLVDPVLDALGVRAAYESASIPVNRYALHDRHGRLMREYSLHDLVSDFGDYRGIDRGALLRVLGDGGGGITYGCSVAGLTDRSDGVQATFDGDAATATFDLVVAADGLHSHTRGLVLADDEVSTFDTDWGGWVAWSDVGDDGADRYDESWGAGFFVGSYPVWGRAGVFVGGPRDRTAAGPEPFVESVRAQMRPDDSPLVRALDAVEAAAKPYYWSLSDVRSSTWSHGRVVLLGDAAAGFLPTAGIGAGMAMESALALAVHLIPVADGDPATLRRALVAYERAQRPRVEAAQQNSRQLARLMARRSGAVAVLRDAMTRFLPLRVALGPIRKLLESRPDWSLQR